MAKIISIHSFRGGTGKSNTTANVAAVLATKGLRVGEIAAALARWLRSYRKSPARCYLQ